MRSIDYLLLVFMSILLGLFIVGTKSDKLDSFKYEDDSKDRLIDSLKMELNKVEPLLKAIHYEEARLSLRPPRGKHGDTGPFQITEIGVKEFNNITGCNYKLSFMNNYNIAKEVTVTLLNKGINMYENKFQTYPNISQIARMHNGGIYRGYTYSSTEGYGKRVYQYYLNYKQEV
jgi:hypothetical protein